MEKVDSVETVNANANAMPVIGDDEDMTYYQDIIRYLEDSKFPDSAPEVYRKQIQKRVSKHLLLDGVLYFKKRKHSLRVIVDKEERIKLLQSLHVDKRTGAHLGLRKVHDALVQNYYWRTCYTDASNIVKQCSECLESMSLTLSLPSREELALELAPNQVQPLSAWKRLELRVHGPYTPTTSTHTHIISLLDPSSSWIAAAAAHADNLPEHIARFMLRTFCDFGPAPCHFIGNASQLYQQVQAQLDGKMLGALSCRQLLRQGNPGGPTCKWMAQLEELISVSPTDWDDQLPQFLWQLRTTPRDTAQLSAFVIMFGRQPNDNSSVLTQSAHLIPTTTNVEAAPADSLSRTLENSTSCHVPPTRRRLRNSFWQCRHCNQDFTSKVSFNIHQRMHIEEAKRRGALEGEEPWPACADTPRMNIRRTFLRKKSRLSKWAELARSRARQAPTPNNEMTLTRDSSSPTPDESTTTTDTVAAVKALLALTKEERNKRGKYRKYTPDLRDEIARYAIARGVCDTTRVFSNKLGFNVSESSVRNFVKAYTNFTPELKEEIGKTAFQAGMEATQQLYAAKLGRELRPAIIRKFKRVYLRKHPELHPTDTSPSPVSPQRRANVPRRLNKSARLVVNPKRIFCPAMKDEMGRFAAEHGVPATLEHYSDKLQFAVKESTVRKFRKKYLDAMNARSPDLGSDDPQPQPELFSPAQPMSNLESEMEVMHHQSSALTLLHPDPHQTYSHPHPAPSYHPPPAPTAALSLCPSREMAHYGQLHSHQHMEHNLEGTAAYDCPPLYSHASNYPVSLTNQTHPQQLTEYAEPSALTFHHNPSSSFQRQRGPLPVALGSQPGISNHNSYNHHAISPAYHLPTAGAVSSQQQHPPMLLPPPPTFQQHLSMASNHANAHSLHVQPALLPLPLALERKSVTTVLAEREEEALLPGSAAAAGADGSHLYQHHLRKSDTDKNLITAPTYSPAFQPHHISLLPAPAYNQPLPPIKGTPHRDLLAEAAAHLQPMSSCVAVTSVPCQVESGEASLPTGTGRPQRHRRVNTRSGHVEQKCFPETDDEEEEEEVYEEERVGRGSKKPAKRADQQRRGNYATYSPELRAEIGKYAIDHGNQQAMVYFKANLGLDIPESTIRGLRDKYVVKRVQRGEKEVTSLGFAQRGRPMRLGKYDGMVQDCIRQLIKSGEKISSFLAIATAKQVLMQHEPALLQENGGPIKLNPTWAKSFLKRMGANNLA